MHPSVFKGIENIFLKAYAGVYQIPLPGKPGTYGIVTFVYFV